MFTPAHGTNGKQQGCSHNKREQGEGVHFVSNSCSLPLKLLNESWSVYSYADLIAQIETLESGGQAGAYRRLKKMLDENRGLSVMEIAEKNCLSTLETIRLFYIHSVASRLGQKGIEAWDKGRELALLRWAVPAGYITEKEAAERAKKITDEILTGYTDFEDFAAHYAFGRGFFGAADNTINSKMKAVCESVERCIREYGMDGLKFASFGTESPILTLSEVKAYTPDNAYFSWYDVHSYLSFRNKEEQDVQIATIDNYIKQYGALAGLFYMKAERYMYFGRYRDAVKIFREYAALVAERTDSESFLRSDWFYLYAVAANKMNLPFEALEALSNLSAEDKRDPKILFYTGYTYSKCIGRSADYEVNEQYAQKALDNYIAAGNAGYELPEHIMKWIQGNSEEM